MSSSSKEASSSSPSIPSVYDSTTMEKAIEKKIEGIRTIINPQYGNTKAEEEAAAVIKINPATKKYCELKIKILQDSPRDVDKLREILKAKQKEYDEAEDSEVIERSVNEIDALKFVLFLVCRYLKHSSSSSPSIESVPSDTVQELGSS
ncbi:MAG: hypothetical protein M3115_04635 [Thermoproteota archaeon]|nr:hypothetical protein [Thermoproteota archaeon]